LGNYFFEWCVWLGYAIAGFAYAPLGMIALAPQAIILEHLRRHGHSTDGEAGAAQQGRRVRGVSAPRVEVRADAAEASVVGDRPSRRNRRDRSLASACSRSYRQHATPTI